MSESRCQLCGIQTPLLVLRGTARLCGGCWPLQRCDQVRHGVTCLGVVRYAGTPDDMTRHRCERCGHETRR